MLPSANDKEHILIICHHISYLRLHLKADHFETKTCDNTLLQAMGFVQVCRNFAASVFFYKKIKVKQEP